MVRFSYSVGLWTDKTMGQLAAVHDGWNAVWSATSRKLSSTCWPRLTVTAQQTFHSPRLIAHEIKQHSEQQVIIPHIPSVSAVMHPTVSLD